MARCRGDDIAASLWRRGLHSLATVHPTSDLWMSVTGLGTDRSAEGLKASVSYLTCQRLTPRLALPSLLSRTDFRRAVAKSSYNAASAFRAPNSAAPTLGPASTSLA